MKRLLPLLLVLVLSLSACGAEKQTADPTPTEEDVLSAYQQAAQVYDWFDQVSPPCTGEVMETPDNSYRKVDVEGLATYADLEAQVRASFSAELANQILSESQNFRDIDGVLYCAEGGRGSNIFLYDKTVRVAPMSPDRFDVTLTFWSNTQESVMTVPPGMDTPHPTTEATFGFSTEVLHYDRTDDGFRFTNFCSSDALDLEADTIYTFNYITDFETGAYQDFGDWQLICYLANSDGAAAEAPAHDLMNRFLAHPQEILSLLARLYESPFYGNPDFPHMDTLTISPAYDAAATLAVDEFPDFTAALDTCQPETEAQQAVLDQMRQIFMERTAEAGEHDLDREFGLIVPGGENPPLLTLGPQKGTFPWGYDLKGTVISSGPADTFGTSFTVDCGDVVLSYGEKDGAQTLYSMETQVSWETSDGHYCTPRGLYCGYSEAHLQELYRHAVKLETCDDPAFDTCYIYEPAGARHIAFFLNDGIVGRIQVVDSIDGQMLDHSASIPPAA